MRPAETQISLRIRAVWSEFSLIVLWISKFQRCLWQTAKTQIRLRECAVWSESSLGAHVLKYIFSPNGTVKDCLPANELYILIIQPRFEDS